MYYTPRRNEEYRRLDRCSPFSMMGSPTCSGCDQYKGTSTCFTACDTNTYETFWSSNQCSAYQCSTDMCIACYKDTLAKGDAYCTACIPNADLIDGSNSNCKCKDGYFYDKDRNECLKCHPYCITCTAYGPDRCIECQRNLPRWNGECKANCGVIDFPFNTTYVYSARDNQCKPCPDYHYTIENK